MKNLPLWDNHLIDKYNIAGPRYTSYPTALSLVEGFTDTHLEKAITESKSRTLSLYIHIPFCHQLCYYCGCNKIVTRHQSKADVYLDYLLQEIDSRAPLFKEYQVEQLHLGGGTPTFLNTQQMKRLITHLNQSFNFAAEAQRSIEVDPRSVEIDTMGDLKELGFNRVSFGVQDFNDQVQSAVNRPQDLAALIALLKETKRLGFKSINMDMIYGLPHQTLASYKHTIDTLVELAPDRVSVFNYAHLPDRFAAQRKLKEADMPNAQEKLAIFKQTLEQMTQAGYQFIGMDHFAKSDDELAKAQQQEKLHRNFQGYTTHGDCDLLGLGVSSISQIGNVILQNEKDLKPYYNAIQNKRSALNKGIALTLDDQIRAAVIKQLICHFKLAFNTVEKQFNLKFDHYFQDAISALKPLAEDGLIELSEHHIQVTSKGTLFIRIICMCFDAYLQKQIKQTRFSRVI